MAEDQQIEVAMNALSILRGTAAGITLVAGVFAAGVRFGPMVAPDQHEAAMIRLAAVFGQDIGPVSPAEPPVYRIAY